MSSSCVCSSTTDSRSSTYGPNGECTPTSASRQSAPLPEESVNQSLSILRSAVDSDQLDPHARMILLIAARDGTAATYEALIRKSPSDLTDDMREVIRLYRQAGSMAATLQSEFAKEMMGDCQCLFDEIMAMPQTSRTEFMNRFVALFLEIMRSMRDTATTLSALGFQMQMNELRAVAASIKAEGQEAYNAGMMRGGFAIIGGAIAMGCGGVSSREQGRVSHKSQEVEDLKFKLKKTEREIARKDSELASIRNSEEYKAGDPDAIKKYNKCKEEISSLECEELRLTDNLKAKSAELDQLNDSASTWMMSGRTLDPICNAVGGMSGSAYDREASQDRTDQTQHQANATAAEQNKDQGEKLFGSADNTAAGILQTYREIGQSEAEGFKAVAHA